MPTAQINARIDSELKRHGDAALESVGSNPTGAVRALWSYLERNSGDDEAIRSMLASLAGAGDDSASSAKRRINLVKKGPRIVERALRDMGVATPPAVETPYADFKERAYAEKYLEGADCA